MAEERRRPANAMNDLRALRWPLAIAAVVVVVDQLTKHWALNASTTDGSSTSSGRCVLQPGIQHGDGLLAG